MTCLLRHPLVKSTRDQILLQGTVGLIEVFHKSMAAAYSPVQWIFLDLITYIHNINSFTKMSYYFDELISDYPCILLLKNVCYNLILCHLRGVSGAQGILHLISWNIMKRLVKYKGDSPFLAKKIRPSKISSCCSGTRGVILLLIGLNNYPHNLPPLRPENFILIGPTKASP